MIKPKKIISILLFMLFFITAISMLAVAGGSDKEAFPEKEVRLIVQASAGGSSDLNCRTIAPGVEEALGVPVIVENRPGGGGGVAISYGASQKPDGYIINHLPIDIVMLRPYGYADVGPEDFDFICRVAYHGAAIAVRADSKWQTLDDLIEAARNNPGGISVGNSGLGAIWHLAALQLEKLAGVEFAHIPYEGAAPSVAALLGGHIDAVAASPMEVGSQVKSGDLRLLGIFYEKRMGLFPDVPTLIELGYNLTSMVWLGFGVPDGTPQDTIDILVDAFHDSYNSERYQKMLKDRGLEPGWQGPEEFTEFVNKEYEVYSELIPKYK